MNQWADILLVDDDASLLSLLTRRLEAKGYSVCAVESAEAAISELKKGQFRLLLSDLRMGGMDGMELFDWVSQRLPTLPVIIMTAHGSISEAVSATQAGVFAFITKPVDRDELMAQVEKALAVSAGSCSNDEPVWRKKMVTRDAAMRELLNECEIIARSDTPVMVLGESGTGKELLAQAIHEASPRADKPFVAINCGALPEALLESELFGHKKGAFTGAVRDHEGLFRTAEGGTLFLDEIGDMPLLLQAKLLRVLQERQVRPVGSTESIPTNVRLISATHRDLKTMMAAGDFREDLYFRLNVVSLTLPPLRERSADIPLLANHFLHNLASRTGQDAKSFSPEALNALSSARWHGNIRQLQNVVEQTHTLATSQIIPLSLIERALDQKAAEWPTLTEARHEFERNYVIKLLEHASGNVTEAAKLAGRNRTDFYKILKRHDLSASDFSGDSEA